MHIFTTAFCPRKEIILEASQTFFIAKSLSLIPSNAAKMLGKNWKSFIFTVSKI
jgi:hypothetical protein